MSELLFPIELGGKEGRDVESLPSYLYRLSYAHGYSVGEILRALYRHASNSGTVELNAKLSHHIKPGELVRPSKTTSLVKLLLEKYTDQDLSSSYLWILEKSLGVSNGEILKGFRWCPECLHEMHNLGVEPYFKLIWSVKGVSACPIHRTPFQQSCASCGDDQTTYLRIGPMHVCQSCRKPLYERERRLKLSEIAKTWENIGVDVVEVFSRMSEIPIKDFPEHGARNSIKSLLDYYWEHDREDEFYGSLDRDELLAYVFNQKKISLKSARRIAFRLGVPLYDFLAGRAIDITLSLDSHLFCQLPPGFLEVSKKVKKDHQAIQKRIKRFIKKSSVPPSIKQVAEAVGVSKGYLEYRHSALVSHLVTQRAQYLSALRAEQQYLAIREAFSFFLGKKYECDNRSKRSAYKVLRSETKLPKTILVSGIEQAFEALGN
tara:strand:- start:2935 stop:4233 length:1299 start_codon:yes stop_codon:yes gene_type:complete